MSPLRGPLTLSGALVLFAAAPAVAAPKVVVDISPIHSIVARVMAGVGEPGLVLPPGASPHGHSMRPSEAALLDAADVVVWVGPDLTPWMAGPVEALASHATVLTLEDAVGVTLLPVRVGGPFEAHHHDDETHEHTAEATPHVEDGHEEHAEDTAHAGHDDHDEHGGNDGHIWLDPMNATAFATDIATTLAAADPENAKTYMENAVVFGAEMAALSSAISAELAPARGKPFIVFHDAYQYFEHRFDIPAAGSVSLAEGEAPSAARVADIRGRVINEGVVCAFTEPQFEPKLLNTVIEGTNVRTGVLDPDVGEGLTPGADLYPAMLLNLANSLATCLAP